MRGWEQIRALTFDCYGTLVDWEAGIVRDLREGLELHQDVSDEELLRLYGRVEPDAEAGPFRSYREVLQDCLGRMAVLLGAEVLNQEALVDGLGSWPLFPDTREALSVLSRRFRLCVVSNVDRDLFAHTEEQLGVRLDEVVTADQIRSYKPASAHFTEACRRLELPPASVAHVAQSLYHDIETAKRLGHRTVWVDRRSGRDGGATRRPSGRVKSDLRVLSLAELARVLDLD